ncbi:MAG: Na+/H+ antiporter NhaC family protein [Planctomycetota bacterium]|nr:Na+/H+ antiporter NhaC family protein [Planctomycetota bacterium]
MPTPHRIVSRFMVSVMVCLLSPLAQAQTIEFELPTIAHTGTAFDVTITISEGEITADQSLTLQMELATVELTRMEDGTFVATGIVLDSSGTVDIDVMLSGESIGQEHIRVIPGWVSILPPILAIAFALIFRNVIPALFLGIWFGAFAINGFTFVGAFHGLLDAFQFFMLNALADADHAAIIMFSLMIGGMVGIITQNGGMKGVVNILERWTTTPRTGQASTGVLGLLIFFDDYANSLVVGGTMRHVTDRLKVSREKLAYIVDSTAAPVSCLAFVTTWIGFEVGLIGDTIAKIDGFDESGYSVFLSSIPYSFYPWLAILFVFVIAVSGRDFGPMLKAERRARSTGQLWDPNAKIEHETEESRNLQKDDKPQRAINAALPILVLIAAVIVGLFVTGSDGSGTQSIRDIIGDADSYKALMWASLLAALTAGLLTMGQGILSLADTVDAWYRGGRAMGFAMVILVMAWGLSSVCTEVNTASYLVSTLGDALPAGLVPAVVFILAAAVAFATGTSWGTMGILIPLVLPLTWAVMQPDDGSAVTNFSLMYSAVACVLAGAVWGDHCSPISDTTILSSMASGCDHIDHVRTQMPYAMTVGAVGLFIGTIPTGFGVPWWIAMPLAIGALILVHRIISKPVEKAE